MNMTNGPLNAHICNSGILTVNMLHRHLVVDRIMVKVLQPVLLPSSTPSAMGAQTHLPTLRLSCLRGRSILHINFQHPTQYISHIQESLLISTSRVSMLRLSQDQSHSWHNLCPLTARCLRLFHLSQSNPEHTHEHLTRTSHQLRVEGTNKATIILNIPR